MNEIENRLKGGNAAFLEKISANPQLNSKIKQLKNGQNPYALVITCSDSRVIPEEIFSTSLGELFVIRTAGNVVNEGELASVEYGLEHLHIKYCLVLAHTHCGAVHASIHKEHGKYLGCILDNISRNIEDEKDEYKASIKNALKQVEYLKEKFSNFDGAIKAAIYDIEDGSVKFID